MSCSQVPSGQPPQGNSMGVFSLIVPSLLSSSLSFKTHQECTGDKLGPLRHLQSFLSRITSLEIPSRERNLMQKLIHSIHDPSCMTQDVAQVWRLTSSQQASCCSQTDPEYFAIFTFLFQFWLYLVPCSPNPPPFSRSDLVVHLRFLSIFVFLWVTS